MKKTVNISIGRIAFTLEEDAHQKLAQYLDDISRSLRSSEGHDEIMADIEARIAELLQQRIKDSQQVVTIAEVDEVISIMGSPETFSTGEEAKKESSSSSYQSSYSYHNYGYKRVFRDPDDKVAAGVCSGLAHHFGIDPLWLRLAFGLSIFIGGFGIIIYFILWIIIPKARTSAEKLEMRGEAADLNNIKRTVEEELEELKKKVNDVKSDFRSGRYRNAGRDFGRRTGDFFSSVGHGVGNVVGSVLRGVLAFVGFILVFIFSVLLIALLVSLFSGINVIHVHSANGHWVHYSVHNLFTMFAITGASKTLLIIGLALFVGVPLLALIVRIGRSVIGVNRRMQGLRIGFFIAWMVGLVFVLFATMQTFGHFSVTGTSNQDVKFNSTAKTLYVSMPKPSDEDITVKIDSLNFYITDGNVFQGNPSLCIQTSPDSNFHLVLNKYARGISQAEAAESADGINYSFSQHDSVLNLNSLFELERGTGWRKQKLELSLLVPANRAVALPEGIDNIMCSVVHKEHRHLGGHKWLMSSSGLIAADTASAMH